MKTLAVLIAVSALVSALLLGWRTSSGSPLPDLYSMTADSCVATSGTSPGAANACLQVSSDYGLVSPTSRFNLSYLMLDQDQDGVPERAEVARTDLDDDQLHESHGTLAFVLFVTGDGAVKFTTTAGLFFVSSGVQLAEFTCNASEGGSPASMTQDEDCDGDASPGDGIVFAHLSAASAAPGTVGTITATDAATSAVLATQQFTVVREATASQPFAAETEVEDGLLTPGDCAFPADVSGYPAIEAHPNKTVLRIRARNADMIDVASAWFTWTLSDPALARLAGRSTAALEFSPGEITAYNVLCGVSPGTVTVTALLSKGIDVGGSVIVLHPDVPAGVTQQWQLEVVECDFEQDGICDSWEDAHPCMDSAIDDAQGDPDGDDVVSLDEYVEGIDPCDHDTDDDRCTDGEELGDDRNFGGERDPDDSWDFYDVTADAAIDLGDALAILGLFGTLPGDDLYDAAFDRYDAPDRPAYRPAQAVGDHVGIDLEDALVNLQSFGHACAGAT